MKPAEVLERIARGDIPSQPFFHCAKKAGYKWVRKFWFADGEFVTAQVVAILRKQGAVKLVVVDDVRRCVHDGS